MAYQLVRSPIGRALRHGTALGALCLAAACSGGGGGTPPPTAAPPPVTTPPESPAPTPAPAPTPTPTPPEYDTSEYRASVGPVSMNALAAYQDGATGDGVTVGIVDTGIDTDSAEFGDRVADGSRNVAGGDGLDDEDGHGTAVAFTLAGRRNGAGSHGVAFGADLVVARGDTPGSCTDTGSDNGTDEAECSFADTAIARGIDAARTSGARIVNLSLGGSAPSDALLQAINRATKAGLIIVIAAGNDGEDADKGANPDPFTAAAYDPAISRGQIIIAGSVDSDDMISDFSNRAGNGAAWYLGAVGERVRAPDNEGTPFLWSGTSFSSPQIAGAAALLAQAFPNLTGRQIVELLLSTARDAGAEGRDAIYGNGILDLTEAFSPQGPTALAGTGAPVSFDVNATLSAPMGDAATGEVGAVILDGYDRAYAIDLARTIDRAGPGRTLAGALRTDRRSLSVGIGDTAIAVTIAEGRERSPVQPFSLPFDDARTARTLAASVTSRLDNKTQLAFGASESGGTLAARLAGQSEPAFLVAGDPVRASGFDVDIGGAAAVRRELGGTGVTVSAEHGKVLARGTEEALAALRGRYDRYSYDKMRIGFDRQFGPVAARLAMIRLDERDTVLGAHFGGALGSARAVTHFLDASARARLGGGWSLGAAMRQGWTVADLRGGLDGSGRIRSASYALDIGKAGAFDVRDRIGLRIAQPLRVASGGLDIALPTHWNYASESVDAFTTQRLNLAPRGREVDAEISYGRPLWDGNVTTNVFYRRDPGNFDAIADDYGMAMRFGMRF